MSRRPLCTDTHDWRVKEFVGGLTADGAPKILKLIRCYACGATMDDKTFQVEPVPEVKRGGSNG